MRVNLRDEGLQACVCTYACVFGIKLKGKKREKKTAKEKVEPVRFVRECTSELPVVCVCILQMSKYVC